MYNNVYLGTPVLTVNNIINIRYIDKKRVFLVSDLKSSLLVLTACFGIIAQPSQQGVLGFMCLLLLLVTPGNKRT